MGKVPRVSVVGNDHADKLPVPDEVAMSLGEIAGRAKEGLLALSVSVGLEVFGVMCEQELTTRVGAKGRHNPERSAYRHGSEPGEVMLGGRKAGVRRPRARTVDGREVELATYKHFQDPELLDEAAFERMVAGLSTRRYRAGLEPVGEEVDERATSKSAVARRFRARATRALDELLHRDLSQIRFVALAIDGIEFADHTCVVALGVDDQGNKQPLGLREGTTENAGVCRALLADLVGRGLSFDDGIFVVIDGGKGLRKAVRKVFGSLAAVQRCQIHKRRNVLDHLPKHLHARIGRQLDRAWRLTDATKAERALRTLARSLEAEYPDAAGSVREGLEETLTVIRLGIPPSLQRTLRSTNTIESMISIARTVTRNVKRWRDGQMVRRWTAAGMLEAEKQFRKVNGYRQIPALTFALKTETKGVSHQDAMLEETA